MSNTVIIIIALLSIISLLLAILFVTLLRKIRSASKDNFNLIQFPKETDDKIKDLIVQVQKFSYDLANSLKREINENKKVITVEKSRYHFNTAFGCFWYDKKNRLLHRYAT